jgi:hypothetical protein
MTVAGEWESFYVIVGSSAGALTGLQFVVMALIADSWPKGTEKEVAAFGTPTIVHFCSALLLLFVGIHNAWDTAAFVALAAAQRRGEEREKARARRDSGPLP